MNTRNAWLAVGFLVAVGLAGGTGFFLARTQSGAKAPYSTPSSATAPHPAPPGATAPRPTQPGATAPLPTQSTADAPRPTQSGTDAPQPRQFTYEELTGSLFRPAPKESFRAPQVRELLLPATANANSVWGAIGRDYRGHIWVGVSATSPRMSAHLLEYNPGADKWRDHGGVVDRLKAAGLHREGEGQIKIHSRIVHANDGWLYFASTDEEGEQAAGLVKPRWGGHLWRIHPERHTWQHLLAV